MSIITVDFDGTLYEANSITATLRGGFTSFTTKQWLYIIGDIIKGIVRKRPGGKVNTRVLFLESFFYQMKGRSKEEIYKFFVDLIKEGKEGVNFDLVETLSDHIKKGNRIVVLSGSLQPFLEIFIQQLDIEADVIGSLLFFDDHDICTGEIGKINRGAEKVKRLKDWIKENKADDEEVWAYADSDSDIPLLQFADKAIVVNPSKGLKKVAEQEDWETFAPLKKGS